LKHKSKIIEGKRQRAKEKSVARKLGVNEPSNAVLTQQSENLREEEAQRKPMTVEEAAI
jgi:hypothetical protein